jgi:hypothetical protein
VKFKGNLLLAVLISFLMFSMSGCIYLVVGSVGVVGGYIVSPDTVEGLTEHDEATVWDAAQEIISIMGIMSEEDEGGGIIVAKVSGCKVRINMARINESVVKLSVKARKFHLPRISISQDVFVKIMNYLNE